MFDLTSLIPYRKGTSCVLLGHVQHARRQEPTPILYQLPTPDRSRYTSDRCRELRRLRGVGPFPTDKEP